MIRLRNPVRGQVPASEIETAYRKAFNMLAEGWFTRLLRTLSGGLSPFQFADAYYQETNETLIKLILDNDNTNLQKYVPEDLDCDDFTFRLMGVFHQNIETAAMPIFIAWVMIPEGGHAVISYVTNTGEVMIIEPQNDQIFPVPKDWSLLLLCG